MLIEAQGVVYDATHQPENRKIAFFTGLCALRTGDVLCSFQVGTGKHSVDSTFGLCRSRDRGATWQELAPNVSTTINGTPGSLSGFALVDVEPGRLLLFATWFDRSDPKRPLFDPETEGILHCRQLMAISSDNGQTWTDWETVPTAGLTGCAATGPVLQWADGTIAFAFESFKEYDDPSPAKHGAWILPSRDGGRSFEAPVLVAQDPQHKIYYWDQRLCTTGPRGDFLALFWTHDRTLQQDLTVHQRHLRLEGSSIQAGPIVELPIPGQIAAPLKLKDGRLIAYVVDRHRPGTMKLWVSQDNGKTWPASEALVVHTHDERAKLHQSAEQVDFAQYWEDMGKWSFGHPAAIHLGDQHVLLTHYAGSPDRMSVHWTRIRVN